MQVRALHDRRAVLTHKALLTKNNGSIPMGSSYFLGSSNSMGTITANPEAGYQKATTIKELAEGLHMYAAAIHMIR